MTYNVQGFVQVGNSTPVCPNPQPNVDEKVDYCLFADRSARTADDSITKVEVDSVSPTYTKQHVVGSIVSLHRLLIVRTVFC